MSQIQTIDWNLLRETIAKTLIGVDGRFPGLTPRPGSNSARAWQLFVYRTYPTYPEPTVAGVTIREIADGLYHVSACLELEDTGTTVQEKPAKLVKGDDLVDACVQAARALQIE